MKIVEIDYTTTPETITERDATAAELAQFEADNQSEIDRQAAIAKFESDRLAILEKLGLTEAEAKILLA